MLSLELQNIANFLIIIYLSFKIIIGTFKTIKHIYNHLDKKVQNNEIEIIGIKKKEK